MKIIIDTNILIRSLINPDNKFGEILLNPKPGLEFIAPAFLRQEYYLHRDKVLKYTKCNFNEFRELEFCIFDSIHFIDEKLIPQNILEAAYGLVKDIDKKDFLFIAFALWFNEKLWSLDKKLLEGVIKKGFSNIISTEEIIKLYQI